MSQSDETPTPAQDERPPRTPYFDLGIFDVEITKCEVRQSVMTTDLGYPRCFLVVEGEILPSRFKRAAVISLNRLAFMFEEFAAATDFPDPPYGCYSIEQAVPWIAEHAHLCVGKRLWLSVREERQKSSRGLPFNVFEWKKRVDGVDEAGGE